MSDLSYRSDDFNVP